QSGSPASGNTAARVTRRCTRAAGIERSGRDDRLVVQAHTRLDVEGVDVTGGGRQGDRLACVRVVAAVDACDEVGALAVDVGVAVEVAVSAELLDQVDRDSQALAVRRADDDVLGADTDGDLAAVRAADGVALERDGL